MSMHTLMAISPLDGRYQEKITALQPILSEFGLIRYRISVEIRWLLHLAQEKTLQTQGFPSISSAGIAQLNQLDSAFTLADAEKIKQHEATTNHDVKAVEYFLQDYCRAHPALSPLIPFIHFGCTSEDINNLAYSLMLQEARLHVLLPMMQKIIAITKEKAHTYASLPMLSRTHGQVASPTTLGKEFANVAAWLSPLCQQFQACPIAGKMNGAVGNFNAHYAAYPNVPWDAISERFVKSLGLHHNAYTTQIEPHDQLAEWLDVLVRFNTVLIDYCRDMWGYISLHYFQQQVIATEVGSSTMPHKVNPIDFENAEGNLGLANALATHMARKLPLSRWQRDLTDSTVMRNLGSVLGYALIAYSALQKGLGKIDANDAVIRQELNAHWEVLAEAVQTILRRFGATSAYESLKTLTRGKSFTKADYIAYVKSLTLPKEAIQLLENLSPENYLGCAISLAKKISL